MLSFLLLIFCFLLFLFCIFSLSREDYILLRKKTTVEDVFNIAFIGLPISLLSARLFFVAFHFKWVYLNPLVFFLVSYFPGLSLSGGILGSILFVWFFAGKKKFFFGRVVDIFFVSFLVSMASGMGLSQIFSILSRQKTGLVDGIVSIIFFLSLFFFFSFLRLNRLKNGIVGAMILAFISMTMVLKDLFSHLGHFQLTFGEDILFLILFITSVLVLFLRRRGE